MKSCRLVYDRNALCNGCRAKPLGALEHIGLHFIARAASKDVVVQALAVVLGLNDGKSQTAPAYWTQHFRGNRARRLLGKHSTPLPADLLGARSKCPFFDAGLQSKRSSAIRSPCDSGSNRQEHALMAGMGLYQIEQCQSFPQNGLASGIFHPVKFYTDKLRKLAAGGATLSDASPAYVT